MQLLKKSTHGIFAGEHALNLGHPTINMKLWNFWVTGKRKGLSESIYYSYHELYEVSKKITLRLKGSLQEYEEQTTQLILP